MKSIIKKSVSTILVLAFILLANTAFAASIDNLPIYAGDVNCDGMTTAVDLELALNYLYQFDDFSAPADINADVDNNGIINSKDCAHIQNICLGIEPRYANFIPIELKTNILNSSLSNAYNGQKYKQELITDAGEDLIEWEVRGLPVGLELVENYSGNWEISGVPNGVAGEYMVVCFLFVENEHEYASFSYDDVKAFKLILSDNLPEEDPNTPSEEDPDTPSEEKTLKISIYSPSLLAINYGHYLTLQVNVDGEIPDGATIKWETNNDNFDIAVSSDGRVCEITPNSNGKTDFKAKIVDADGNVLAESSSITLESHVTLWDRIFAFFERILSLITNVFK